MPKQYKVDKVAELKEEFQKSPDFILTSYRGLTVFQITDLRNKLREHSTRYHVVKNNLARIALRQLGVEGGAEYFEGPTAIAFSGPETPGAAKVLVDFQEKSKLEVKAAFLDGGFLTAKDVVTVSKLPGKKVILSQIAGGMVTILSRFAGDMQSVLSTFAMAVKALEDKKAAQG